MEFPHSLLDCAEGTEEDNSASTFELNESCCIDEYIPEANQTYVLPAKGNSGR